MDFEHRLASPASAQIDEDSIEQFALPCYDHPPIQIDHRVTGE
jgi:hypothetical protein